MKQILAAWAAASMLGLSAGQTAPLNLSAASSYSDRHGGGALIVSRGGKIQLERYGPGNGPHQPAPTYSIAKSLCALAVLAAVGDRLLDLEEPVSQGTTVRALLHQTSGLPTGRHLYSKGLRDKSSAVRSLVPTRNKEFQYGPSHYELLAAVLEERIGAGPGGPTEFVRKKILLPIGAGATVWRKDSLGSPFFSAGMRSSPRGLLAAGNLVLKRGRVGWRRVVPSSLVEVALRGSEANPAYGMGFWLNANASLSGAAEEDIEKALAKNPRFEFWRTFCLSRSAPTDLVAMAGSGGQRVYISPSLGIVVVRMGSGNRFSDPDFLAALFSK